MGLRAFWKRIRSQTKLNSLFLFVVAIYLVLHGYAYGVFLVVLLGDMFAGFAIGILLFSRKKQIEQPIQAPQPRKELPTPPKPRLPRVHPRQPTILQEPQDAEEFYQEEETELTKEDRKWKEVEEELED